MRKMSLSELTKQAEVLLGQSVPLKKIKSQLLAAGYSSRVYEAVERILYAKNLVPLTKWQKLKKETYSKIGVVSIDPKKKMQVFGSVIMFLVLMVYFIAVFRNLDKGPFYAFINNPIKLAFSFKTLKNQQKVVIHTPLVPKLDSTLTGFDADLKPISRILVKSPKETVRQKELEIDGHILAKRMFFDTSSNTWKMFTLIVQDYLASSNAVITGGKFALNAENIIKKVYLEAKDAFNRQSILVVFDSEKGEDILFLKEEYQGDVNVKGVIPFHAFLKNVELAVGQKVFLEGETQFNVLPEDVLKIRFTSSKNEVSDLIIKYHLFRDPVTKDSEISFGNMALKSTGLFVSDYPVKRRGPVPVSVSKKEEVALAEKQVGVVHETVVVVNDEESVVAEENLMENVNPETKKIEGTDNSPVDTTTIENSEEPTRLETESKTPVEDVEKLATTDMSKQISEIADSEQVVNEVNNAVDSAENPASGLPAEKLDNVSAEESSTEVLPKTKTENFENATTPKLDSAEENTVAENEVLKEVPTLMYK